MTKHQSKPTSPSAWIDQLDPDDISEAYDVATTDAFGDYEKHTAFLTAIGDELWFPFNAKVMGQVVNVVKMEWPESDEFGLDLIVESTEGPRHRIAIQSIELFSPFPDGAVYLAAYLDWRSRF